MLAVPGQQTTRDRLLREVREVVELNLERDAVKHFLQLVALRARLALLEAADGRADPGELRILGADSNHVAAVVDAKHLVTEENEGQMELAST